jgi:DNA-binding MarR family transcriptional regulator
VKSATTEATIDATSPSELASRLRLAITRLSRRLRQQAASGDVSPSQLATLATIERHGPLPLGELAQRERVQPPTMTRIVAALEDAALVERHADASDRRVTRIAVSPVGAKYLAKHRSRKDVFLTRRLAELSPADSATLLDALPILERLIDGDDDDGVEGTRP